MRPIKSPFCLAERAAHPKIGARRTVAAPKDAKGVREAAVPQNISLVKASPLWFELNNCITGRRSPSAVRSQRDPPQGRICTQIV